MKTDRCKRCLYNGPPKIESKVPMGQEVSQISCKFKRMYSGQGVVLFLMFDRDENTWLNFFIICKEIHIQISLSFIFIVFSVFILFEN